MYIGSTKDYKTRWTQYIKGLRNGNHPNQHLQNAWNKYGEDYFKFEVLEEVPLSSQFQIEQEYLNRLKPFGGGYNILRNTFSDVAGSCVIRKKCRDCEKDFDTLNDRSITCDKCRSERNKRFAERCYHCEICPYKKLCQLNMYSCDLFLQCFGCKYASNCDTSDELLNADLHFIETVSEGYLSPDDFWECN